MSTHGEHHVGVEPPGDHDSAASSGTGEEELHEEQLDKGAEGAAQGSKGRVQ
jgi:hypothetical protein